MSRYLDQIEPEDVRFLMDLSEFQTFVRDMLGKACDLVTVHIDYDRIEEPGGITHIRPMVNLTEATPLTEDDRHTILQSGFSIAQKPFDNGDLAMKQIFGPHYTVLAATDDEDGAFFTIELPYRHFLLEKENV